MYAYTCMYVLLKACFMLGNWHSDIIHIILIVLMLNKHVGINNTCAACMCGIHEHIVALELLPVYIAYWYIITTFLVKLMRVVYTRLVSLLQLPFFTYIPWSPLKTTHIFESQSSYQFVVFYNKKAVHIHKRWKFSLNFKYWNGYNC